MRGGFLDLYTQLIYLTYSPSGRFGQINQLQIGKLIFR